MRIDVFRPIYYLGCKTSFTSAIRSAIDEVDPTGGRLVDLFAGTGAVGAALAHSRDVTTVDVQEYSRVLCSAVLRPPGLPTDVANQIAAGTAGQDTAVYGCLKPLIDYERHCIESALAGDLAQLIELLEAPPLTIFEKIGPRTTYSRLQEATGEVVHRLQVQGLWQSRDTTVTRHFGGVYFSFPQAVALDAMLSLAEASSEGLRDTLKAAALGTASLLVNTVGKQFAQPLQPRNKSGIVKSSLAKVVSRDRSMDAMDIYRGWLARYAKLPRTRGEPQAIRADYLDAMRTHGSPFSVVYADPPYTRDHYSRFYHVLETMCLRDEPQIAQVMKRGKVSPSRGLYREDRHQSPFCIRSAAPSAFSALFQATRERDLPLVLSYSPHEAGDGTHPRVVSVDQIVERAKAHYARVDITAVEGVTHNKLNRRGLKLKTREHAEILVKCFR